MRKMRKGFTLVELLIVIAILGTLSAGMTASMGKSTATAKAATIVANIDTCKMAARLYYAEKCNTNLTTVTAAAFLNDTSEYVPNWKKFVTAEKNIVYGVDAKDSGKGSDKWALQVDFSTDPDAANILSAITGMPGYDDTETTSILTGETYKFKVDLMTGKIAAYVAQS